MPPVLLRVKISEGQPDTICYDDAKFSDTGMSHTQETQARVLIINMENVHSGSTGILLQKSHETLYLNSLKLSEH